MAAAAAAVALLGVAHAGALAHAARGQLHLHGLPVHHHAVELFDGVVDVARRVQVHEAVVAHDVALHDRAELLEQLADLGRARLVREVPDEDFSGRRGRRLAALGRLDFDRLPVHDLAVEVLNGLAPDLLVFHVHETVISDDIAFYDRTVLFEQRSQIGVRRFIG